MAWRCGLESQQATCPRLKHIRSAVHAGAGRDPAPPWQVPAVISWAGMRGVVTLAAAFSIPPLVTGSGAPFPGRAEILFLAFCVTVGALLLHGLALPWVIRRLGVEGRGSYHDALAEADAMYAATQAALQRLEAVSEGAPELATTQLRKAAEHRSHVSGSGWGVRKPSSARRPASFTAGCG